MKTKLIFFISGLFILFGLQQAHAQSPIFIGVKGGIDIPNLHSSNNGPEISRGYSSRMGPYFGIFGEFKLSKKFSLQPEVNYSSQGGKKNSEQTLPIPAQALNPAAPSGSYYYVDANYKSEAKLNYIEVPVLAKFTFPLCKHFNFFIDAGPYAGFLIRANDVITGSAKVYMDEQKTQPLPGGEHAIDSTNNIKDQLHTANFGIQGGIGFSYSIGKGYFFVSGGGNYGFIEIQKNTKENGKDHTGAATVTIGYALKLN